LPSTIERVHREYAGRIAVVAVNLQEPRETVARWVREKGVTMPVLLDPSGAAARAYKVTATPTTYLVGRDGRLVGQAVGTREWLGPAGRRLLDALPAP
jgi:hypothetical protein